MNCYVMNPYSDAKLPSELNKDNTLFYPEDGMTTEQMLHTMRPRDFHIVTDSHLLVPLYSLEEVFIWKDNEWVNPEFQTYACSYNMILNRIFGYRNTIPQATLSREGATNCMGSSL